MKASVMVLREEGGLHVYLLDPADRHQAVYDVSGCSNPLSDRDVAELTWAADHSLMKPRDVIAATRSAIKALR